ncbi:hypothetical protein EIP86_001953 [Pleurotus ostreatoroseus]|nr:hypothetical protein EIP86_001953 [Pleurotus ostreatoroseus]
MPRSPKSPSKGRSLSPFFVPSISKALREFTPTRSLRSFARVFSRGNTPAPSTPPLVPIPLDIDPSTPVVSYPEEPSEAEASFEAALPSFPAGDDPIWQDLDLLASMGPLLNSTRSLPADDTSILDNTAIMEVLKAADYNFESDFSAPALEPAPALASPQPGFLTVDPTLTSFAVESTYGTSHAETVDPALTYFASGPLPSLTASAEDLLQHILASSPAASGSDPLPTAPTNLSPDPADDLLFAPAADLLRTSTTAVTDSPAPSAPTALNDITATAPVAVDSEHETVPVSAVDSDIAASTSAPSNAAQATLVPEGDVETPTKKATLVLPPQKLSDSARKAEYTRRGLDEHYAYPWGFLGMLPDPTVDYAFHRDGRVWDEAPELPSGKDGWLPFQMEQTLNVFEEVTFGSVEEMDRFSKEQGLTRKAGPTADAEGKPKDGKKSKKSKQSKGTQASSCSGESSSSAERPSARSPPTGPIIKTKCNTCHVLLQNDRKTRERHVNSAGHMVHLAEIVQHPLKKHAFECRYCDKTVRWGSESSHAEKCEKMPHKEETAPSKPRKRKRESENAEDDGPSRTVPSPGYRSTLARSPIHLGSVPRPGDMRSEPSHARSYAPSRRPPSQTDITPAAMYPYASTPDFGSMPQFAGPSSAPSVPHHPSYYAPSMPSFMPTMPLGGRMQVQTVPSIPSPEEFCYGLSSFDVSGLMPQASMTPASSLSEAQMRQLMNYDYFGSLSDATGSGSTEPNADGLDPANFSF